MEIFNQILYVINWIVIAVCSVAFGVQFLYVFFFWVKPKKYKPAEVKHKAGIIIPARNEASVIGDTVKCILSSDYPKELFDVFVVADNCTDNTAQIARDAGAIVFEHFDDDPKHKKAGYALQYGFEKILESYDNYEFFIKFDADNLMEPDYISKMNDAFDSGVQSARGYENSKNLGENVVSGISGLWYIRDCRFSCNARSFLGSTQMLGGAGMMFSAEIIRKHGGWDCLTSSDDAEFAMKRLLEGTKTEYVSEAVVYEDQPNTVKDTFKRNMRMGRGLFSLFFTKGLPSLGKFFCTLRWSYLDMFLNLMFIPLSVMFCIWLPLYYTYDCVYNFVVGNTEYAWTVITNAALAIAFAFVVPFILQALLAAVLERKKIKVPFKKLLPAIFAFPLFMIIYAISITAGVFSKPKWSAVARSSTTDNLMIGKEDVSLQVAAAQDETTSDETADTETENSENADGQADNGSDFADESSEGKK